MSIKDFDDQGGGVVKWGLSLVDGDEGSPYNAPGYSRGSVIFDFSDGKALGHVFLEGFREGGAEWIRLCSLSTGRQIEALGNCFFDVPTGFSQFRPRVAGSELEGSGTCSVLLTLC